MKFERIEGPVPSVRTWGCMLGVTSFCISFDTRFPNLGYRVSRRVADFETEYFPDKYRSFKAAKQACIQTVN